MVTDFNLTVDGNLIRGELHTPLNILPPYPAVIVCHGIPSGRPPDPNDRGYRFLAERLAEEGFMAAIFNFRGCGLSGGNIDLEGWCRDLGAVIDLIYSEDDFNGHLSLFGFSGGAAVSCKTAALDLRVSAAVLAASPADFGGLFPPEKLGDTIRQAREVGVIRDQSFPPDPEKWLKDFYGVEAKKYIGSISPRPVLIVHGSADDLIPVSEAHLLYECAGDPKELVLLEGAGHRLRLEPEAVEKSVGWLRTVNGI